MTTQTPLLQVRDLRVTLGSGRRSLDLLRGLSFDIHAGETFAVVGESGCGKSMTSLAIMRLLTHPLHISQGQILFEDQDLTQLSEKRMRAIRGARIGMVFQEPMSALNPVFTVGHQIMEIIRAHEPVSHAQARARAIELLAQVRLPDPERLVDEYPHRLSGGQRQRIVIAIAIACRPKLLIADEPTTALDVTIQAQILDLLKSLQRDLGIAVMFITHNLGVVAQSADRVMVMYAGRKVEQASVSELFESPRHPYTQGLLRATPSPVGGRVQRLHEIPGIVPMMDDLSPGCAFSSRCSRVTDVCRQSEPELTQDDGREVACFLAHEHTMTT